MGRFRGQEWKEEMMTLYYNLKNFKERNNLKIFNEVQFYQIFDSVPSKSQGHLGFNLLELLQFCILHQSIIHFELIFVCVQIPLPHTHRSPIDPTCFERITLLLCQILTNDILCALISGLCSVPSICLSVCSPVPCTVLTDKHCQCPNLSSTICWLFFLFVSPVKHWTQFLVLTKLLAGTLIGFALNSHIVMVSFVNVVSSRIFWNSILMRGCLDQCGPWAWLGELSSSCQLCPLQAPHSPGLGILD